MGIIAAIRIVAGVGLSVINAISAIKHVKEAKDMGLINPTFPKFNISTSYGYNNNNYNYYSPSRRFSTTPVQPVYTHYTQPVQPFVSYNTPNQAQEIIAPIRPIMVVNPNTFNTMTYTQPAPPCQMYSTPATYQQPQPQQYDMSSRRFNNSYMQNYQNPTITMNTNQYCNNYGYDTLDGLENISRRNQMNNPYYQNNWYNQQPQYQQNIQYSKYQPYYSQKSYNEPGWCDKSIGQMQEEAMQKQQRVYQPQPYQQKPNDPLVNWQSEQLRWRPEQGRGIVAMFRSPDGIPLWSI